MIVVADTGPLNYLVLIKAVNVLPELYGQVVVPRTVTLEMNAIRSPVAVRNWISKPPDWLHVVPDPPIEGITSTLDPGERAAIAVALFLDASRFLIDDSARRQEAERRSFKIAGTVGILAAAHCRNLLDSEEAIVRLASTNFYMSQQLLARVHRHLG